MLKIKLPKYRYLLHCLSSDLILPEFVPFNSLIKLFLYAYDNCIDFTVIFSKTEKEFSFVVSDILDQLPTSSRSTSFDQYFLGFVSLLLTTRERDIFKKKLRSYKNV